jgi:hypothetical protein
MVDPARPAFWVEPLKLHRKSQPLAILLAKNQKRMLFSTNRSIETSTAGDCKWIVTAPRRTLAERGDARLRQIAHKMRRRWIFLFQSPVTH